MTATVLFISPDYASHYYPMSAVAEVLQSRGHRVVFATGDAIRRRVAADGLEHSRLVLGPGSNSGVMRSEDRDREERTQMEAFFGASRRGMAHTLEHQARARLRDLLFEPVRVASDIDKLLDTVSPDVVVTDHLAFNATAALRGLGQPYVGFHPGHPSAIPTEMPYGYPPRVPMRIRVDEPQMEYLRELCNRVDTSFTTEYNEAVGEVGETSEPVVNAFRAVSPHGTLVNYPAALGTSYGLPLSVRFIGAAVRRSRLTPQLAETLSEPKSRPRIYVSFGSFFSVRSDLLRKTVTAFRREPVELVIARGATALSELGEIPGHWTVAEHLPQPAVIARSSLVITHGGNNTVTEALAAGVPMLVGPLSTDQFAAAADLETAGLGRAFDPNHDDASTIADLADEVMTRNSATAAAMGQTLQDPRGQVIAADFIESAMRVGHTERAGTRSRRV